MNSSFQGVVVCAGILSFSFEAPLSSAHYNRQDEGITFLGVHTLTNSRGKWGKKTERTKEREPSNSCKRVHGHQRVEFPEAGEGRGVLSLLIQ